MDSLAAIQAQIAELKAQEAAIRQQEYANAVVSAQALITTYMISARDLKFATDTVAATNAGRAKRANAGQKAPIKYQDKAGNTWSGRGLKPKWLSSAIESGQNLEDFLVPA